jgi:hypothetical protein
MAPVLCIMQLLNLKYWVFREKKEHLCKPYSPVKLYTGQRIDNLVNSSQVALDQKIS